MTDQNLSIWKCPLCKTVYQVHPEPAHPWSKENHLLTCAEKHKTPAPQYSVPESTQHFNYHPEPVTPLNNTLGKAKGTVEAMKKMNLESLLYLRWGLFIAVVADIFGIYWYLEWKTLGTAIMLVLMLSLALTFILENRRRALGDKEPKPIDLGLKDMQKNMSKGFGMGI